MKTETNKPNDLHQANISHGSIHYFNNEGRYGYILGDDSREYHFVMRDTSGGFAPAVNAKVSFVKSVTLKGVPKALSVIISSEKVEVKPEVSNDSRVTCGSCGKKMIPRAQFSRGEITRTYCPFCTGTYKQVDTGYCFIATAIYGGYDKPQVIVLRGFRDNFLSQRMLGRLFIKMYYKYSPSIASSISKKPFIMKIVRVGLDCLLKIFI